MAIENAAARSVGDAGASLLPVIQADRDAARDLRSEIQRQLGNRPGLDQIEDGDFDVQLLARHRLAQPQSGDVGAVRDAIAADAESEASACRHAQASATSDTDKLYRMGQKDALLLFASRIRDEASLPTPTPDAARRAVLEEGEWFYPEGDHSSDECRFSPDEVIDYALEGENRSRVVCIERAASLPSVYAAVRVWTDAEKDDRQSDDDYSYTLFATADEAKAALAAGGAA